ncbi:MAG: hypothetical protein Alis3KO_38140 [Aliiglaciecola sp.]
MEIQRNHYRPSLWVRLSTFSLVLFSSVSLAVNTHETPVEQVSNNAESSQVEIITVTGERPLSFFRNQFKLAENDFFTALNNLTDQEEFKIVCDNTARTFTHVSLRACQPKYVKMVKTELTEFALNTGSRREGSFQKFQNLPSKRKVDQKLAKKRKEHLEHVKSLVKNNPDIQLKLLNLNKAKYSLEQKRVEFFGERWVSQTVMANVASTKHFVSQSNQ